MTSERGGQAQPPLELVRNQGAAFVMVTHDEALAKRCDRVQTRVGPARGARLCSGPTQRRWSVSRRSLRIGRLTALLAEPASKALCSKRRSYSRLARSIPE